MIRFAIAALAGLLFGVGLALGQMTDPARVLGFLAWRDPTLAFVMGGALLVSLPGFALARRRAAPFCAPAFASPATRRIERSLLGGAALFGVGWGLVGLCPGPAIANLDVGAIPVLVFTAAMALGLRLAARWQSRA